MKTQLTERDTSRSNFLKVTIHRTGIEHAIDLAGGQSALADALGVKQAAVWQWMRNGYVPLVRAKEIEAMYGVPKLHLINPDLADAFNSQSPRFPEVS